MLSFILAIAGKPQAPTIIKPLHYMNVTELDSVDIEWSFNYESWQYGIPLDFDVYCRYKNEVSLIKVATNSTMRPFLYKRTISVLPYSKCSCFIQAISNFGQGQQSRNFTIESIYETGNNINDYINACLINIFV